MPTRSSKWPLSTMLRERLASPYDFGLCKEGGTTPNEVDRIEINVDEHEIQGQSYNPADSEDQVLNEIRRTIGHEVGHGGHIEHRPLEAAVCFDGATLGNDA